MAEKRVDVTYAYDSAFNLRSMTTLDGTNSYTYDATGQLVSTDSDYTTDESYAYDDTGNRVTANGDSYVTGADNQLLSNGAYRYAYDAEGNRIARFIDADSDGLLDSGDTDISIYTWDYRNRLTAVATFDDYADYSAGTSSSVVSYTYDYANRLVGRTFDADGTSGTGDVQQTVYSYDGYQIAQQFDKTYANGSATDLTTADLSHRYLWNPQAVDHLFADEEVADAEVLYALTDHQGSVRDLATYDSQTDVTTIANHRVYDAYGNLQSETNSAVDSLFGYTCRPYDEATGLQNNLHRWYDASTGRWLSQDPIGFAAGDANVYRYCGNSPITNADPTGLQVAASAGGVIPSAGPPILPPAGSYFPFGTPYEPQYPSIIPPNWPNIDGVEPPIIPPPGGFWPPILPPQWPPIPIDSIIPQDWPRLPPPGWGGSDNGMSIQFDPEIFIISPLPIYYGPRSLPELCPQNKPDWWESRIQSLLPISPWPNRPDYMPPGIPDVDKGTPGSNPGLQGGYQNSWPFEIPGGWIQGKIETGLGPSGPSDLNKPNLVPWGIRITIPTTPPPKK